MQFCKSIQIVDRDDKREIRHDIRQGENKAVLYE